MNIKKISFLNFPLGNKKLSFQKKILFLLIVLISINITYAQSIGVEPKKSISVKTRTPVETYFRVSQGARYAEMIRVEENYNWISIDEPQFILESKTGKSVKVDIYVKKPGTHIAYLRICGSPITPEGATLSTKACASHKLTVIATLDTKTKVIFLIAAVIFLALVIFFSIYFLKKLRKKRKKAKKRR